MRYLLFAIAITAVFTIFTTVFAASANPNQVRLLPKWLWVALCLLVPIVGGLLYVTLGRPTSGSNGLASSQGPKWGPGSTTRTTTTIAPDDDPDFLRRLREKLNREDSSGQTIATSPVGSDKDDSPNDDSADGDAGDGAGDGNGDGSGDGGSSDGGSSDGGASSA